MLSGIEKQQLLYLLQDPKWKTVEQFSEYLCKEIKDGILIGSSEWETLKDLLLREGQIQGIKRFINELYKQVQEDGES